MYILRVWQILSPFFRVTHISPDPFWLRETSSHACKYEITKSYACSHVLRACRIETESRLYSCTALPSSFEHRLYATLVLKHWLHAHMSIGIGKQGIKQFLVFALETVAILCSRTTLGDRTLQGAYPSTV